MEAVMEAPAELEEVKSQLLELNNEVLELVKRLDKGASIIRPLEVLKYNQKATPEQLDKLEKALILWQSLLTDYENKQTELDAQKRHLRILGLTTRDINQLLSQD